MAVNLSVVDGGKHWTKAEIESRESQEIHLPKPRALTPPSWLSSGAKKLFRRYAKELLDLPPGVVSTLDVGTLARYCDLELSYAEASAHKTAWLDECAQLRIEAGPAGFSDLASDVLYGAAQDQVEYWTGLMVKYEKACRGCATEMGLTVASRCRLVVPKAAQPEEADPLEALQRQFLGG